MNGNGYDAAKKPSMGFFTKEQRARLEALTAVSALGVTQNQSWLQAHAKFVETGKQSYSESPS